MNSFTKMTEDQFDAEFNIVPNHIFPDTDYYETYGEEIKYVLKPEIKNHVWTMIDGDDGVYYITDIHYVNRINYFITKESHAGRDIEVKLDSYEDE